MNPKVLTALILIGGLVSGTAAGLLPLVRVTPELVEAERQRRSEAQGEAPAKPWDFWTVEMEALSAELRQERTRLEQRSVELDARANQIAAEAAELERTRREIESMRGELNQRVYQLEASEARNLRSLATTYSALEPASAIAILSQMEDTTVVKILALMKPDAVAAIFNQMGNPGAGGDAVMRAARLSEKLRLFEREPPRP